MFEKGSEAGGRNKEVRLGGCSFDGGPTLLMMIEPFRRLYSDLGECFDDHLDLRKCEPCYRVFFSDKTTFDASSDRGTMASRLTDVFGTRAPNSYEAFLSDVGALYRDAIPNFVERNYDSPLDFFGPRQLALVARHGLLGNLAKRVARYFDDPKLRMLFSFQTMYLGLSPFESPWVYSVLAYMELGEGIWYPIGGLPAITRSLERLGADRGVDLRLDCPATAISGGSVTLANGETHHADAVICNADLSYAERELLHTAKPRRAKMSCSALVLHIAYRGSLPKLLHHNVFFGKDFEHNLRQVFSLLEIPDDPSFYAAVSCRTEPGRAAPGCENLMILIPCPNLERPFGSADEQTLRDRVFERLAAETGFEPSRCEAVGVTTPNDWKHDLNLEKGAAFGLSHHLTQSAYFRPANRCKTDPKLYFVGASTVPGNGLPMVLISAELAVQRLIAEQGA